MDRLRPLWDFDDLDLSERRFTEQLDREVDGPGRAEVLTQLARVEGLRGAFDRCGDLLDEAARVGAAQPLVDIRVALERGRMFRSSGDPTAAYPLFVTAFELAVAAGEHYLAADGAHMAALAAPDDEGFRAWTTRGVELGEREPAAAYWRGPLLNNLGWRLHERGAHDEALSAFERALAVREEDQSNEYAIEIARHTVAVALRSLGRPAEAADRAERAVAWSLRSGRNDPYFHEELAEDYAALGRVQAAAEQARRALELFGSDVTPPQRTRLEELITCRVSLGIVIDHCVIAVSDWERSNVFYRDVLGAEIDQKDDLFGHYRFGDWQLNVHGPRFAGLNADRPVEPGNSDLCFVWPGPIDEAVAHLARHGVEIVAGPLESESGAGGLGRHVYFRDPDGSLLEFVSYL